VRLPRLTPDAYRRVTLVALVLLVAIIVSGGAVRLTGSGLGCLHWPNCEGGQLVAAKGYHAKVEYGNRIFTALLSVAVIAAVLGALVREPRRRDLTWLSWGLVAGMIAQIILGAIVVKTDLVPAAVIPHFLLSIALVWDAAVLHQRAGHADAPGTPIVGSRLITMSRVIVGLVLLVLVLGTLVTGSGPHSGDPNVTKRLGFDIQTVARIHGTAVLTLVAVVIGTLLYAWRTAAPARVLQRGELLLVVGVAQAAIGYTQYFTGVPVMLVGIHVLGAVLVFLAALHFHFGLWDWEPEPSVAGAAQSDRAGTPTGRALAGTG
jgi:cytochrome c oxidase assembly protein subunit 15